MRNPIELSGGTLAAAAFLLGAGCVVAHPSPPPYYWAEPPNVVEIEPGVAVIPEWQHEVFYSDGWYWTRYEGRWYQGSGRHNDGWHFVEAHQVPRAVADVPPGRYVQWHPPPQPPPPHAVAPTVHPVTPVAHPTAPPPGHTVTPVAHPPGPPPGHAITPVEEH
jgi:hypothetical protein